MTELRYRTWGSWVFVVALSVTTFFVTSAGPGKGGDLGGLVGADAHCQALAKAEGSGDHTWRAYLSTTATATEPAVHARDRIGKGPWYNAEDFLVAANVGELHSDKSKASTWSMPSISKRSSHTG
jgi:predicted ATPase